MKFISAIVALSAVAALVQAGSTTDLATEQVKGLPGVLGAKRAALPNTALPLVGALADAPKAASVPTGSLAGSDVVQAKRDVKADVKADVKIKAKIDAIINACIHAVADVKVKVNLAAKVLAVIKAKVDVHIDAKLELELLGKSFTARMVVPEFVCSSLISYLGHISSSARALSNPCHVLSTSCK